MLDIHQDTGQAALRAAGLLEAFGKLTLEHGDAMRILDKTGTLRMAHDGDGLRPEIDRGALRNLLLSSLPPGLVRWNARVTAISRENSGFKLSFADGSVATAEILIGAGVGRGQRSAHWYRRRIHSIPASASSSCVIAGAADRKYPTAAALVGEGLMFALSDERGIFGHREPNNELCIYAALKVPADWSKQPVSRDLLHQHFHGWHADFHEVLANSDGDLLPRSIWMLPEGHSWPRASGVTLLGDAAHLMSPFAGEGANLAMIDGADLASAIIAHPNDIEGAFAAYKAAIFPRAREAAAQSSRSRTRV